MYRRSQLQSGANLYAWYRTAVPYWRTLASCSGRGPASSIRSPGRLESGSCSAQGLHMRTDAAAPRRAGPCRAVPRYDMVWYAHQGERAHGAQPGRKWWDMGVVVVVVSPFKKKIERLRRFSTTNGVNAMILCCYSSVMGYIPRKQN